LPDQAAQQLVDEQLVEKRRGLGMFVAPGASKALLKDERHRFLETEWPKVQATIQRLGLNAGELLDAGATPKSTSNDPEKEPKS